MLVSLKAVTVNKRLAFFVADSSVSTGQASQFLDTSDTIASANAFESIDMFFATDIQSFLVALMIRLLVIASINERTTLRRRISIEALISAVNISIIIIVQSLDVIEHPTVHEVG
jgi:hypothetical protein